MDNDTKSPLLAKVDREGIYGFRIVVFNGAGFGGEPPQSGDVPEILIGVDLTEPVARILAVNPGRGAESGSLIVTWEATDKMLARRPISLLFGPSSAGPWNLIAHNLDNTGRYAWPIGQALNQRLYLKIEARDEAGNVGTFQTAESVLIDRTVPAVRIRGVHSYGNTSRPQEQFRY